ncbi:putative protein OS=Bosea thiooxidans OX=53254 GN=SAMN05660750_03315 PE=4 SV=1 [Bosea thiooxidans]|uniref:Uncharacterized protein n=1 Tax=Bosea thiooxidans TaxID=53254 RepID=A0A1T5FKP6_9HYPH|nr:hypothetical protein [Bosea thiooxidans]SKB96794.1 hypothetical protein SAMN05660750_03315 [Bosea thiooxidans]
MAEFVGLSIQPHNDLRLDETGSPLLVFDAEAIGEHIRQRVMFWRREWFLNEDAGVEWTKYVLGRPPSELPLAESIIKAEIAATPGVTEILEFSAVYDRASRGLRIERCQVATVFDDIVDIQF